MSDWSWNQLLQRYRDHQASLFQQGFLDDQFRQLQKLQDDTTPNFVVEVVEMFFQDSERLINSMSRALVREPVDFNKVNAHGHQQKGSSASIGAARVKDVCANFKTLCEAKDLAGCAQCLHQLQQEYTLLKENLQYLFRLQREIKDAGGPVPPMD